MEIRERILTALNWGVPDRVPLTIYEPPFPRGEVERLLRESGVGLIARLPVHKVERRQVEVIDRDYWEHGRRFIRRTLRTPIGEVSQLLEPDSPYENFQPWIREHFIKGPEDYRVMQYVLGDEVFHDNYDQIREAGRRMGADGLVIVRLAKSPMQEMLYQMMGLERFGLDYHFRRDLFDSLYHTMLERYEELYTLAAGSPVEVVQLADNITADVVGEERFRDYIAPVYKRLRERLSASGRLLAVHMDGRLKPLLRAIGQAEFDIVEALTPPPVGTVSVAEAREAWKGQALWLNFTSSMHLESAEAIEEHTRQLLAEAGNKRGFVIGVTEAAPVQALEKSLRVIARVLNE
ncbi:MAG: hypothetical protein M0Z94_01450 [Dehalococcoidales bacterium]|nr:hypothetical protein [Dehalococcoidales bacterium]